MKPWEQDDTFLSRWLNNELSEKELREFESSEEGKAYIDMMLASKGIGTPTYDVEKALSQVKSKIGEKKAGKQRFLPRAVTMTVAATVTLLAAFAVYWFTKDTVISTGFGEQQLVTLPGGSKVTLHANSSISYDEDDWSQSRTVELEGEAYFDVSEGSLFSVNTAVGTIEVLGTSFNIKSRLELLQISCYQGSVKLLNRLNEVILEAGEGVSIRLSETTLFDLSHETPSWLQGVSSFNEAPLDEVVQELEVVFGMRIENINRLPKEEYTGSFPHSSAENALRLVFEPFGVDYEYNESRNTLILK
ncbi:DUF4974 domain-containing protein [Fulvivirga sp. RKSG066]|uniref:FecR family protein n=1 Tax=Fulvivirga aurantia TaxID=2529383 RepID=UPI0012BD4113|nr:FecR domain-containing protein [Fulvivirga aurantia]MTI21855.1 DUF4974 domain-containing protein [Fulvivirga aurantia]